MTEMQVILFTKLNSETKLYFILVCVIWEKIIERDQSAHLFYYLPVPHSFYSTYL